MAGEIIRPGTEILQTRRAPSPTIRRSTLVPCNVGPAFEIVNVLTSEGGLNPKAKYGEYGQIGRTIAQSSFPDPRGNIDELDFIEESIRAFVMSTGRLSELVMGPGEAFLTAHAGASAAALKSASFGAGLALDGKVMVIAIDQPAPASTAKDITITFRDPSGAGGPLTAAAAAAQINEAVGRDVAVVDASKVQITSPTFGALSSLTVRAGGSANALLQLGAAGDERIEGSGWKGLDDNDNDTQTPWVHFHVGAYTVGGVTQAMAASAGLVNVETRTFVSGLAAEVTFGTAGIPLKAGDMFYADGLRVAGEISKVEAKRFRLGNINTALSVADSKGRYVSKVLDAYEVNTLFSSDAFAPKYVYFVATGLDWRKLAPVAAAVTGSVAGTAATQASITGVGAGAGPFNLAGLTIDYVVKVDGVENEGSFTFTGSHADMAAVAASVAIPGVMATDSSGQLRLATVKTGRLQGLTILATGTANDVLGLSVEEAVGKDIEITDLAGTSLKVTFDGNPHVYEVNFADDSLDLAVSEINSAVGATVASKAGSSLKLTSTLKGKASKVTIVEESTELGLTEGQTAGGSGRPLPNAYLDSANNLVIGSQIVRDLVTGAPLDQALNPATLYIQYKALRKDVSPSAKVAGVLRLATQDILEEVLSPISEENPLALATFLTMINAPNFEVKALGVDEISPAAPEGTSAAYARAAELLEAEEVYAVVPLSQDETVQGLFVTHAQVMSSPEQGGERIVFINKAMPTRKNPVIALSGTSANTTGTANQLQLDGNPASGLLGAGINPSMPMAVSDGVYCEFELGGELVRYSVANVSGPLVNLRTTVPASENLDGFYTTGDLTVPVVNGAYALKVRGTSLVVPGSNPPRLDYSLVAETVAEASASIGERRAFTVFPDTIEATIRGIEKTLPGYYACSAIAGMVAAQPASQPFTNFPITGITGVVGTERFSKKQLNVMAGGGVYILMQEVEGGAVFSRHQLSTDTTSIETRELSITKAVDFTAKTLRTGLRRFIGTNTITNELLDGIGTTLQGMLQFLVDTGILNGFEINNLIQDVSNPDTLLVDVTLDVPFPCNYIRLTLVV